MQGWEHTASALLLGDGPAKSKTLKVPPKPNHFIILWKGQAAYTDSQ